MHLASLRLQNLGPFGDLDLSFLDADSQPRMTTVLLGESGVGKTTLLQAIALTRPGLCVSPPRPRAIGGAAITPLVVTSWRLGEDDPARPHPLVIVSPNGELSETPAESTLRKREQVHFDRLALLRGFCLVAIPSARWASRSPMPGIAPDRAPTASDARLLSTFDDAARADFARELKQALANAVAQTAIRAFRAREPRSDDDETRDGRSTAPPNVPLLARYREAFAALVGPGEASFDGIDPDTYEPLFRDGSGTLLSLDDLGSATKNRLLIAGVLVRRLAVAHPGVDPADAEGVALIDGIDERLSDRAQEDIVPTLRRLFPKLQLIVTTQSPRVAARCGHDEVFVVSRDLESGAIAATSGLATSLH